MMGRVLGGGRGTERPGSDPSLRILVATRVMVRVDVKARQQLRCWISPERGEDW